MAYVLITGSSSGIGQDIAISLSKEYDIILHGRDIPRLKETKQKCSTDHDVKIWQYDLFDVQDIESNLSAFITENGLEVAKFVHCAGYCKKTSL